jgi:hypothetical protein
MTVTRFEGEGPVARYWLAHCEGFAVQGGTRGTVEELIRDADPHVTTRILVRTRTGRRRVIPARAVASVLPAERLLIVAPRRRRRPPVPQIPDIRPHAARVAAAADRGVRSTARVTQPRLVAVSRAAGSICRPAGLMLVGSLRILGRDARATSRLLYRISEATCLRSAAAARRYAARVRGSRAR